jgi:hypothetical protein
VTVNWRWLLALPVLVLIGYGFGRYASPAKVVTTTASTNEVRAAVVEVKHEAETETQAPVDRVYVTRWFQSKCPTIPGEVPALIPETTVTEHVGPVVIERTEDSDLTIVTASASTATTTTTTTAEQPRLMLQAGASSGLDFKPAWNVGASYRLAGPFWLGVAYRSERQLELRASLSF